MTTQQIAFTIQARLLLQVDKLATAIQEPRSAVLRRLVEAGLDNPKYASILQELDDAARAAQKATEDAARAAQQALEDAAKEEADKRAAVIAARRKARRDMELHDQPAFSAVAFNDRHKDEAPLLQFLWCMTNVTQDQWRLYKAGIDPMEPEWTAPLPTLMIRNDGMARALGYQHAGFATNYEEVLQRWRDLKASTGRDPLAKS